MGTNFYLQTKVKQMAEKYAPYEYHLTDIPDFGYEIHIAKTSYGWLPLFEAHKNGINSVSDIKAAFDTGEFKIYDEYLKEYTWEQFTERVLKHNGGIKGVVKPKKVKVDKTSPYYDADMPDFTPISHFDYGHGKYYDEYFKDDAGYEFTVQEFS